MASSLCRSSCLTNWFVQRVAVLDIKEVDGTDGNNNSKEWAYVISVTWSDTREIKIFRRYSDVTELYNQSYKLRYGDKTIKSLRNLPDLPKVPARGFFDWSVIKLMIRHQPKVERFLKVLISLPIQISRQKYALDFFEMNDFDNLNHVQLCHFASLTSMAENCKSDQGKGSLVQAPLVFGHNRNEDLPETQAQENHRRSQTPPSFLPIRSCFEPDDDFSHDNGYQTLLEDITSLELYEDYENLYETPLQEYVNLRNNLYNSSPYLNSRLSSKEERWLKECKEILSPYSPNKDYFHLVHVLDNQWA